MEMVGQAPILCREGFFFCSFVTDETLLQIRLATRRTTPTPIATMTTTTKTKSPAARIRVPLSTATALSIPC